MSPESPGPREANDPSSGSTSEQASFEQEYEGYESNRNKQLGGDYPDVVLDVPVLKVDEIDLEVEDLKAHVSLRAELADLVRVNVGVDVDLGKVRLGIKGVEAQALLTVKLDRILKTLDRALDSIDRNPQILSEATRGTSRAGRGMEGMGQVEGAVGQAGRAAERADESLDHVTDETEQAESSLLDETVDEGGRTVRRSVDEAGNITETTLNESGDVVGEEITDNLADLQIEDEYVDDQGRIVRRALDESGNVYEETLDEEANVLDLDMLENAEDREAEGEDSSEVRATEAAKRKARELGMRLSEVKGTGSGGRVLVKDVERAAR